jgi:hypothetical protein
LAAVPLLPIEALASSLVHLSATRRQPWHFSNPSAVFFLPPLLRC